MCQAIKTKYIGPTNSKGSRVKATCDAGSITINWQDALNTERNHAAARDALCVKLGWTRYYDWTIGWIDNAAYHVRYYI